MKKNILEYINELMDMGYSEETAEICADALYSERPDSGDLPDFNSPEAWFCEPD